MLYFHRSTTADSETTKKRASLLMLLAFEGTTALHVQSEFFSV